MLSGPVLQIGGRRATLAFKAILHIHSVPAEARPAVFDVENPVGPKFRFNPELAVS
jgi:hypothetical protein